MSFFLRITAGGVDAEVSSPAADRLVSGAPVFTTWLHETSGDEKTYAGVWQSTPGAWRVVYDEWEYCTLISGHSILTEDDGTAHELKAGDHFVIRPGFSGVWQVVETTQKTFVVRLS